MPPVMFNTVNGLQIVITGSKERGERGKLQLMLLFDLEKISSDQERAITKPREYRPRQPSARAATARRELCLSKRAINLALFELI